MHYYKDSHGRRDGHPIAVGDAVVSRYRARWRGTVVALAGGEASVRQEVDQHGNPFRKPRVVTYHCTHFRRIAPAPATDGPNP